VVRRILIAIQMLAITATFRCKARAKHRLAGAGTLLLLAIIGTNLLPLILISIIAGIWALKVGLDLYQGRPARVQADTSVAS